MVTTGDYELDSRTMGNGVQGVAGSNPAVPTDLTRSTVGNCAGGALCFNKRWCRLWCCFANHLTRIRGSRRPHQPDASAASRIFFGSLLTANNLSATGFL